MTFGGGWLLALLALLVSVIVAYAIYYYLYVVLWNKTHVILHPDASAASSSATGLFPAWLLRGGRRTRLAALLWDEQFRPHPFLLNGHLQTVIGSELRRAPPATFRRYTVPMSDGELAIVDELMTPTANNKPLPIDAPVVVILHGLSGSSDSNYIRWLLHSSADSTLCSRAVRFLVLHARGAALERAHDGAATGTHRLQRPLFYNAAFTRDLHEFGDATRRQFPAAPLFLVGFSMGGNIATKMLSEAGAKSPFLAACVVCNPFDLNKITDRMLVYPGLIYSQLLVRGLKRFLERNHDVLKHAPFDMAAGMSARTVHEFDKRVVVPLHGYSDVRSYYTEASSSRRVDEITIPFLSFSSGDDPLCDSDAVPRTRCAANSIFAETPFGGHVAHIESMSSVSYIDKVVLAFVDAVLEWRETAAASALSSSS